MRTIYGEEKEVGANYLVWSIGHNRIHRAGTQGTVRMIILKKCFRSGEKKSCFSWVNYSESAKMNGLQSGKIFYSELPQEQL